MDTKFPRWAQLLVAVGGVIVILAVALIVGNKIYYQISRPSATSTLPSLGQPSPTSTSIDPGFPFDAVLASAKIAGLQQCYPVVDLGDNVVASVLTAVGQDLCKVLLEKGVSAIQHPLATGINAYADHGGIGIMISNNKQFLVSFYFHSDGDVYEIILSHASILKNTSKIPSFAFIPIQSTLPDSILLQVAGTNASGSMVEEYFARAIGRYADGSFSLPVEKNADGTFSNRVLGMFDTDPAHVSFLVPYMPQGVGESLSDRDHSMELQNKLSPVYHKAACGLEEIYGDVAFSLGYSGATIAINFGYEPVLHITTALQGYVPEQWGKILANVTMADFRKTALTPQAFNSKAPVEMLTSGGYSMKHVGPITPDRTCRYGPNWTYDMYQTIKNGAVLTFVIENRSDPSNPTDLTPASVQKMIEQVLTSLTFSSR